MAEYRLPTIEGRELQIRPCAPGERPQVQIAIKSTCGNIIEAVTIEAGDILGLARGLGKVAVDANERFGHAQIEAKQIAEERYQDALAANPWLNGERGPR